MEPITIDDVLYAVITVAVPVALRFIWQIVSAKVANTKYAAAVDAVFQAVTSVNQTFVDSLKASGSFDDIAKAQAFMKAKDAALSIMDAGVRKWLEKTYTDLDTWFEVQIEAAVKSAKGGEWK